jgi:hypothetical protein
MQSKAIYNSADRHLTVGIELQTGRKRPLGVTIVAILMIINGIILIASGIGGVTAGAVMGIPFVGVASSVLIALGIAALIIAWGLITGKGWAWIVTVILSMISIIMSIIAIVGGNFGAIINLIISGVILYYMYRPDVKAYFGRKSISV